MTIPVKKFGSYHTGTILGHRVYAKLKWQDDWQLKEHVMCESASWSAAPSMGSATLYYRYGPGVFPGVEPGNWLLPFDLPQLAFVRIDFDVADLPDDADLTANPTITTRSWYGVVGTLVEAIAGADVQVNGGSGSTYVLQGKQTLNAVGLEWFLDRQYVMRSWIQNSSIEETRRGSSFNLYGGLHKAQNRSMDKWPSPEGTVDTYVFSYTSTAKFWSTRDIIEYLLAWHMGRSQSGLVNMPWKLADDYSLIRNDQQEIPTFGEVHGSTVWQLLNQLLARQRGYSFYLQVHNDSLTDSSLAEIQLVPFTVTAEDIILPLDEDAAGDPPKIPSNPNIYNVDLTNDRTASPLVVTADAFSQYDQVEVYGARAVHCVTLEWGDFEKDWLDDNKTAYDGGGNSEASYPASGEVADRQRWNAEFRTRAQYQNVYRRFILDDFLKEPGSQTLWPDVDDPIGNPTDTKRTLPPEEMPIWDRVPLLPGVDYSNRAVFKNTLPEYWREMPLLEPSAYFEIDGKWYSGQQLIVSQDVEAPSEDENFQFSCRVSPVPERPGTFYLDVFGQPQHVIAKGVFVPLAHDKDLGGVSYEDCYVTLAILGDYHSSAKYPEKIEETDNYDSDAILRVRTINAGDQYQFHLLIENTIYGVQNGQLQRSQQTMIVRDDRTQLKEIAKMAYAWYGKPRRPLQFSTQFITNAFEIGDMISTLVVDRSGGIYGTDSPNTEQINTCITSITIRNQVGSDKQSPPMVEYKTEFSELDVISYFT